MNSINKLKTITYQGIFIFDSNDLIYNDHFPGKPTVPGTLIITSFLNALFSNGYSLKYINIQSFKFKHFIRPGQYHYKIDILPDKICCTLYDKNNIEMSKGIFVIKQP